MRLQSFKMAAIKKGLKASFGLLAASSVHGTPSQLFSRGTIPSNEVIEFGQTVPSGVAGTVYLAYKPYLDVVNGCVPFPAVDKAGNTKSVTYPRLRILGDFNIAQCWISTYWCFRRRLQQQYWSGICAGRFFWRLLRSNVLLVRAMSGLV